MRYYIEVIRFILLYNQFIMFLHLWEKNVNNKGYCVMDSGRREMKNTANVFI